MEVERTESQRSVFFDRFTGLFARRPGRLSEDEPPPRTTAIVVCIIISFVLWLTLTMQQTHEMVLPLAIRVENLPPNQMLAEPLPRSVRVTVEAERIQLLGMLFEERVIPIDAAAERVMVEEVMPSLGNVRVLGVTPNVIEPRLEELVEERIPIRLRHDIQMPSGYEFLAPPTIMPDSVVVTGARSLVEGLNYWPTERFTYENLKDTLRARVALSDTLGELVRKRPEETRLTAIAGQFIGAEREIDVHPRGVPASAADVVALDPPTIRVRYRVLFAHYEASRAAPDFYAEISYDQIRADQSGYVRPVLQLPQNLEIRDAEMVPSTVGYYDVVSAR